MHYYLFHSSAKLWNKSLNCTLITFHWPRQPCFTKFFPCWMVSISFGVGTGNSISSPVRVSFLLANVLKEPHSDLWGVGRVFHSVPFPHIFKTLHFQLREWPCSSSLLHHWLAFKRSFWGKDIPGIIHHLSGDWDFWGDKACNQWSTWLCFSSSPLGFFSGLALWVQLGPRGLRFPDGHHSSPWLKQCYHTLTDTT